MTSEKLLNLVGALSLKEKFSFLEHFDLIPKLEGKTPFSPEEIEEIQRERLRTNIIDESRFGKGEFFPLDIIGDPLSNDGQVDRQREIVSPLDGIGFRPTKENFQPREGEMTTSPSLRASTFSLPSQHDPNAEYSSKHVQFSMSDNTAFRAPSPNNAHSQTSATTSNVNMSHQTSANPTSTTGAYQGPPNAFVNTGNQYHQFPTSTPHTYYTNPAQTHQQPHQHQPPTPTNFNPHPQHPSQYQSTGHHPQFYHNQHHYASGTHHTAPQQPPYHGTSTTNHMPQGTPYGFMFRAAPRTAAPADYDNDRIIIARANRGATVKERAKVRELCTTAITPQITRSNITKLLTSDATSYDIAEDAAQWQTTLRTIYRHVVASDFKHIVMIPLEFDEHDKNSINASTQYVNAVLDHDKLTDEHYKRFQRFLRRYGRDEEVTSDSWFEEKLWKSLSSTLLSEVSSEFLELDKDEDLSKPGAETCKGSITLLRLIINRVVQSNQESRRALEEYIKTFDICRFSGEDVTAASLRIKAVARALGVDNLSSDIIHCVLEGFAHASTPMFQTFCATQESLITSSLIRDRLRNKHTLYKMLVDILTDLEIRYTDLRSGHRWLGHGHGSSTVDSVFVSNSTQDNDDDGSYDDDDDYAVYFTSVGRHKALPFDVWVRDKKCHHCGELGHIRPQCPTRHRTPARSNHRHQRDSSKYSGRTDQKASTNMHRTSMSQQRFAPTQTVDNGKRYAKKVLTAALEMVDADDHEVEPHDDNITSHSSEKDTVDISNTTDSKYSAFLAALGCSPKE